MKISAFNSFVCPVDGLPLVKNTQSLRCEKGHEYDIAREGYYNLLLVQQKASLDPGDSKEMVAARRRFLDSGHFTPVADKLFEIVSGIASGIKKNVSLRIVDAGCGEGYYLDKLKDLAKKDDHPATFEMAGCDISKWAIKAAAKRSSEITWAVAGNKKLPFPQNSVDVMLSMFGFPDWESFKTVQPAGGHVLLVDPGTDHLIELRRIIYPAVNVANPPSLQSAIECGYVLKQEDSFRFSIDLKDNSQIQDLLAMTPHAFKIEHNRRQNVEKLNKLTVSVDLVFRILQLES